jgi:zinc transporter, ZIP family
MLEAAFWGIFSASSLLIGAVIALRWRIAPRIVGLVLAFGAGALISAVSFELVLDAKEVADSTGIVGIGLAAGALTFFGGDWWLDQRGGDKRKSTTAKQAEGNPQAIMLGTILDGVPESIVIGGSLVVGGGISAAMVAAAFMSNLPEALGATAGLAKGGVPARRLMRMWGGIVALSGISAAFGYWVLRDAPPTLGAFFQTFAAGAVLTMLTDTMIPEAYEEGGKLAGLVTVLGFALALGLSSIE